MQGIGISEGIAIGKAWLVEAQTLDFSGWIRSTPEEELQRFALSQDRVRGQLEAQMDRAEKAGKKAHAEVLEAHCMMLEDPEMTEGIRTALSSGMDLPGAVGQVLEGFAAIMGAMEDSYLQQRAQDYLDIKNQLLRDLAGVTDSVPMDSGTPWIPMGVDFSPSDIGLTDNPAVQGFLCQGGAATTHFSILAKIAGVPTVIQAPGLLETVKHGDQLIVDGGTGEILINPSEELLARYEEKQETHRRFKESLEALKTQPPVTRDGILCHLEGNIAGPQDIQRMLENGAQGIGLFRTEFIYMDRSTPPTEEEQLEIYSRVLRGMGGRPVVIRTLDVGGDKELPYLGITREDNPFLGFRAVRYCLAHPALFKTQLRALLRASVSGKLQIMVPMISGLEEVRSVRRLLAECREELKGEGHEVAENVDLGIMIEVPAAAAMAPLLAEEVDFFSIGTNDLIQYVMAADRMNPAVAYLYTPYHPAFLRTLQAIIQGAHGAGIPAAMCGELAGDADFIPVLVGLGLDIYSMNAGALLKAKHRIRTLEQKACRTLVEELLCLRTEEEIKAAVHRFKQRFPYETA